MGRTADGQPAAREPAQTTSTPVAQQQSVPPTVGEGVRWLTIAAGSLLVATLGVALTSSEGPRPVPLLLAGATMVAAGLAAERRGPRPVAGLLVVAGAAVLLLGAQALLQPTDTTVDAFLGVAGAAFLALGFVRNDRRPVAIGILQWAVALGRPTGDTFRHCLVARDVLVPLPHVLPVAGLGLAAVLVAVTLRRRRQRVDAAHGLETTGLALLLGGLAAKALELPGHPALCGHGDAIDAGWALLLLATAAVVGVVGVVWSDREWAAAGLAAATLFGLAAVALEHNPWWGLLVGAPLLAIVAWLDAAGVPWPSRRLPEAATDPEARP